MIRLVTALSGICLIGCSAKEPSEPKQHVTTPPVEKPQKASKIMPVADVKAIRVNPETTKQDLLSRCEVIRSDTQTVPPEFKRVSTSPDGTNALYSDGGFLGGDHNVFDEISGIIKGDGYKAIIVTPSESITITVKGVGIGLNFRDGKLRCNGISKF